jgi:hypothetical protein
MLDRAHHLRRLQRAERDRGDRAERHEYLSERTMR